MKMLSALALAGALASGMAFACDDSAMLDDGVAIATKAPEKPVAVATDKTAPLTVTTKKAPAKQKSAAKPLPQGATLARTASN